MLRLKQQLKLQLAPPVGARTLITGYESGTSFPAPHVVVQLLWWVESMITTTNEEQAVEIDYLHPNGKPVVTEIERRLSQEEQKKPVSRQALEEADGHHICSERCRNKHR